MATKKQKPEEADLAQFDGFPAEGLKFLRTLRSKDKARFDANRETYQEAVVGPTKAFVVALGELLAVDHPRADHLRRRGFLFARWLEPTPELINSSEFADYCLDQLTDCAELHRWTVENL